jgi:hypothetical protein
LGDRLIGGWFPKSSSLPLCLVFVSRLTLHDQKSIPATTKMSDLHNPNAAPISGNNYANGHGAPLDRVRSLSISPEVFEKLYLSPQNAVKGDLRKTFGNPTPLCVPFPLFPNLNIKWNEMREDEC